MFIPMYPDHGVIGYGHRDCGTKIKKLFTLVDNSGKNTYVLTCEKSQLFCYLENQRL